jgi:ribosomal protein S27E
MGGPRAAGPGGTCRCPNCGHEKAHVVGEPCYKVKCPKCGEPMTRA